MSVISLSSARGLDISAIKVVINYDVARSIDTHVHRIGRTGRAGEKGVAHTLVTQKDVIFAGALVRNLVSVCFRAFCVVDIDYQYLYNLQ